MKTITQYREDIKALMKKAADIDAKCGLENREPNEAELSLKNEIMDTVEEYGKILASMERQERLTRHLDAPANPPVTRPGPSARAPERTDRERFGSFGQQLAAVMHAGMPGGRVDPRLFTMAASGLNETVPSEGGFLV